MEYPHLFKWQRSTLEASRDTEETVFRGGAGELEKSFVARLAGYREQNKSICGSGQELSWGETRRGVSVIL